MGILLLLLRRFSNSTFADAHPRDGVLPQQPLPDHTHVDQAL
jgi:hypothetical protein